MARHPEWSDARRREAEGSADAGTCLNAGDGLRNKQPSYSDAIFRAGGRLELGMTGAFIF